MAASTKAGRGVVGSLSLLLRLPLFQPLRGREFRLVWVGEALSLLGDNVYFIALTWLTVQLTGSGLALGSVLMAAAIPRAVFMVVGGALSDRFSPGWLMLISNVARALLVAVIAMLAGAGAVQLWHLYLLAASFGLVDAFFYPAVSTIVPSLVEEERLAAGNALMRGAAHLSGLIGPAAAGLLIAFVGNGASFTVSAAGFALAALMLAMVNRRGRRAPGSRDGRETAVAEQSASGSDGGAGLLHSIGEGLRYSWSDPAIRAILVGVAVVDFSFVGPITVGLASLADRRFGVGSVGFGTMMSALGGGVLLGLVIAGSLKRPRHRGWIIIALLAVMGSLLSLTGLAPNCETASALVALMGVGAGMVNVLMPTWLQTRTDPAMLGRVMSLVMLASAGMAPLSYAFAGALVDLHAVVLFGAAGALLFGGALLTAANPVIRAID